MKYIVFRCGKCKRWVYTRSVQKTHKCGLCQRSNSVPETSEFHAEKPTEAMHIINALNLKDLKGGAPSTVLASQSKLAPVTLTKPKQSEVNSHYEKFLSELRTFQRQKFITQTRGIPDRMITDIMRNSNIPIEKKAEFIAEALRNRHLIRAQTKNSFFVPV